MILRIACLATMILASGPIAASTAIDNSPTWSQVAALGDIGSFRAITTDTLALTEKGDITGAQKRGTDLETAWDQAEDALKPTDPKRWRVVDKAIDRVLAELRAAQPQRAKITEALRDLLGTMDKGDAA